MHNNFNSSTITFYAIPTLFILAAILFQQLRTNMSTQKALLVKAIAEPLVAVTNWPIPKPGPKQFQVRVTVGGLNPHDQKGRDMGLFIKDHLPAILGSDIVGVVTALGEGASRFKVGERVVAQGSMVPGGLSKALQEYAVFDEAFAAPIPESVSDDEAATLPTNLVAGK